MSRTRNVAGRVVVVALAACAISYGAHVGYTILRAPAELRVQFIPDDAYYYLTLARNFSTQGRWTFDSGVSLTTGFHPLQGYMLAAAYSATHAAPEPFVTLAVFLSCLLALPAALAAAGYGIRSGSVFPCLLLLLFSLSRNVALNLVSALEWSWVVLLAAGYCLLLGLGDGDRRKGLRAAVFTLGFLGSLARTDFGLLPAALAGAALIGTRARAGQRRIAETDIGLAGAVAGVGAVLLHNYLLTGQALQSSVRMKGLWMQARGISPFPVSSVILNLFGVASKTTLALFAVLALAALVLGVRQLRTARRLRAQDACASAEGAPTPQGTLWLGAVLAVAGYVLLYTFGAVALQGWYTANLVVPLFLVFCLPFANLRSNRIFSAGLVAVLVALISGQVRAAPRLFDTPEWPHQAYLYQAGRYLREAGPGERVGSWNAGIIGYYEGGRVVNLDGLVNNDVFEYAARNRLPEYIDRKEIRYLMDFENMFYPHPRQRGGYDRQDFLRRLEPVRRFSAGELFWRNLTLFRIRAAERNAPAMAAPEP